MLRHDPLQRARATAGGAVQCPHPGENREETGLPAEVPRSNPCVAQALIAKSA
jgi:hypothetical protein